jgi:putative transposase
MLSNECYFYTDTICDFKHLLKNDDLKMIIINSWQYLTANQIVEIFGYVIMPNHIHVLWSNLNINPKESPAGSFTKFTAHAFKKYLLEHQPLLLDQYESAKKDRGYQFWKRDPLAIPMDNEKIFLQKLDYIHANPIVAKWKLASTSTDYRWSSARFYETGDDEFGILKHYQS